MSFIDPFLEKALNRLEALERRVEALESRPKPGPVPKPILARQKGVCGLNPCRDSATCTEASIYRRQQGCEGDACDAKYTGYYAKYRRGEERPQVTVEGFEEDV